MDCPERVAVEAAFADSIDHATHRYKTTVHRGPGYIANDGYRYIVATSARAAFDLARTKFPVLMFTALQARRAAGKWSLCSADDLEQRAD